MIFKSLFVVNILIFNFDISRSENFCKHDICLNWWGNTLAASLKEAQDICASNGSKLLEILDDRMFEVLVSVYGEISSDNFWLNLRSFSHEWQWLDGTSAASQKISQNYGNYGSVQLSGDVVTVTSNTASNKSNYACQYTTNATLKISNWKDDNFYANSNCAYVSFSNNLKWFTSNCEIRNSRYAVACYNNQSLGNNSNTTPAYMCHDSTTSSTPASTLAPPKTSTTATTTTKPPLPTTTTTTTDLGPQYAEVINMATNSGHKNGGKELKSNDHMGDKNVLNYVEIDFIKALVHKNDDEEEEKYKSSDDPVYKNINHVDVTLNRKSVDNMFEADGVDEEFEFRGS
ncbi:hypothetical protein HELRODRAFT_182586 [Helobdella robusta]|uniref:C-type lectin domain-containing protein n=1 Tax=Helobdella robusta TaxID=6412 RepID=T1FIE9_HELRO|nr:hypothetical protein HELRODRAFT_182586 [Helobdella robusta]ESN90877.1 hypothetical protein HELRODRAFT_182586 [Helobdella robusta]